MKSAIEALLSALSEVDHNIKCANVGLADHRKRVTETKERLATYRKKRGELAAAIDKLERSR